MGTALVTATYGMTSGRIGPTVVAVVALLGVVAGGVALRRGRGGGVGLVLGVVGAVLAATADGGPGTGNGIVGSLAAVLLGVVAVALGAVALTRTRRATRVPPQRVDA